MFPVPLQKVKVWLRKDLTTFQNSTKNSFSSLFYGSIVSAGSEVELVPCTQINVHKVWSKVIGKLSTEIPVRKADLNGDGVEDIIIGFAIGESTYYLLTLLGLEQRRNQAILRTGQQRR